MSNLFLLFLVCSIFLSNCTRTNNFEAVNEEYHGTTTEITLSGTEELNIQKFVKAEAGLRVRNYPDLTADIIAVLENLTEVRIIREGVNNVTIDGNEEKWVFIETTNIQGWVFSWYLTLEPVSKVKQNS